MHLPHYSLHYQNYLQTLRGRLVASFTVRDFVISMSSFLVPVYLYSFGYSLKFIATYFMIYFAVGQLVYHAAAKVIGRFGLYHAIFTSYIALALSNFLLLFADQNVGFVYAAGPFLLISTHFFWPARHIDIAQVFESGKRMRHTTSVINTLSMFVSAIAPLFGGLLAAQFGPVASLSVAFVIMLFAIGLLLGEYRTEQGEPISKTFDLKYRGPIIGNMAKNFEHFVTIIIWPLFVYITLENFGSIGLLASLSLSLGLLITYASGNWLERFPYFWSGTIIRVLGFPLRAVATSLAPMLGADMVSSVGGSLANSRYQARFYNHAVHSHNVGSFIFTMEKAGDLAKMLVWVILLIALQLGASDRTALIWTFIAAGLVTPLAALMGSRREE